MPLVFGWYPPPNVAPDLNTASVYMQPSMLPPSPLVSPQSIENPVEVASSENTTETFYSSDDNESDDDEFDGDNDDVMEGETDNFFDCEMETDDLLKNDERSPSSQSSSIHPSVQLVSKRNLQKFETDSSKDGGTPPPPQPRKRATKSNERDNKRNSMSSLQSKSGLASTTSDHNKSKVKKSLSNNDLKLVKPTSIWSASPFRRVLSPFSSSPPKVVSSASNLKRSGSTASTSSRSSLSQEKKRKSVESKVEN